MTMFISALTLDGSAIQPAWVEMESKKTVKTPESYFAKGEDQCFRCTLPDCDENSRGCQIYLETGASPQGKGKTRVKR